MNEKVERYVMLGIAAISAALAAVPEWGQSKWGLAFGAIAFVLLGKEGLASAKEKALKRNARASMPPGGES